MAQKLILLENEPLLMRALTRALSRLDLTILQAQSSEEALGLLDTNPDTAVLVTDYFLNAGETSEPLLNWTRTHRPSCRCVLMSGQDMRALALHETLYDLFIPKPFSVIEFREIICEQVQVFEGMVGVTQAELVS